MTQSVQYPIIAPSWMFVDTNGAPIEIKSVSVGVSATTSNATLIAAVTGKRLRVIGMTAVTSSNAVGVAQFLSGSGGAQLFWSQVPNSTTAGAALRLELNALGYMDTALGVGLFVSTAAADMTFNIRYIEYTQAT